MESKVVTFKAWSPDMRRWHTRTIQRALRALKDRHPEEFVFLLAEARREDPRPLSS